MGRLANALARHWAMLRLLAAGHPPAVVRPVTVLGMELRNPLGLAAGFDRTGRLLPWLDAAGFGFAELGTVTPEGAPALAARLAARPPMATRIWVNMGSRRPGLDGAVADDYGAVLRGLAPHVPVAVANLSCRRLSRLRGRTETDIAAFLDRVAGHHARLPGPRPVLAAKLDMAMAEAWAALPLLAQTGFGAVVAVGQTARAAAATRLPLVAIGGIAAPEGLERALAAGAALAEVYGAFVAGSVGTAARILQYRNPSVSILG
jgi:dihydroorotate dehydrogenase